jgi:signal peptidase I
MDETLHNRDRVLVNKLSYRLHDPRRGDVVVLKRFESGQNERDLIKRVIALPGETVQIRDCAVYIDGKPLDEPYLEDRAREPATCGSPGYAAPDKNLKVGDHEVFVLGDNRGGSGDSRLFGSISEDLLIGRAFVIIWPFGDWHWL